ncbi:hypothetical protein N7582_005811 [Saccharomyces uvarum]|uniref:Copper transport protein n=1 Tax=Saccharomyces uvarum TaxID=230603 RepID=A0AA35JC20_SACUV|nr:hypothetical protein N7582_005811 [Saccharomyces uvarum]CAI4053776.1 hypothetical protein SUVC_16G3890 [Saccharomyces uvarum]
MNSMSMSSSSMNMDAMSSASSTVASSMASMSMDAMSSATSAISSSMSSMMSSVSKTVASSMASMSMDAMSSATSAISSSMSSMASMSMASMSMGSSSMASMSMGSSSMAGMSMGSSSMAGMSMGSSSATMSSASAQSTSDSTMSGMSGMSSSSNSSSSSASMDMDMDMGMNYYLTPTYKNYPVLFHHLHANTSGKAFGIFLLIVVAAFVYKLLLFVSWCLEVHWFKKWDKQNKYCTLPSASAKDEVRNYGTENNFEIQGLPKLPNLLGDIFVPSLMDLFHDIIRTFLVFTSTMIIYMLMLATMSFVLTYVFAVITGLALSEVFFNRCKLALLKRWDIQREIQKTMNCPGFGNCQCGKHAEVTPDPITVADTTSASDQSTRMEKNNLSEVAIQNNQSNTPAQEDGCNCAKVSRKNQENIESNILESSKLQEQSGNMDQNLLPAEKFSHN